MSLTVLSDTDVKTVIGSLSILDVLGLQSGLRKALHEYSTGTQGDPACAIHQPDPSLMQMPNGRTSHFMPSTTFGAIGMKGMLCMHAQCQSLAVPGSFDGALFPPP